MQLKKSKTYTCSYCGKRYIGFSAWFFRHFANKHPGSRIKARTFGQ